MELVRLREPLEGARFFNLHDKIAPEPGIYATYNILSPAITIERRHDNVFISCRFMLQTYINGSDQLKQRYNRYLSTISLKYLFPDGEYNITVPNSDILADIQETTDIGDEQGWSANASGGYPVAGSGGLQVHILKKANIQVQRKLTTWRCGVKVARFSGISYRCTQGPLTRLKKFLHLSHERWRPEGTQHGSVVRPSPFGALDQSQNHYSGVRHGLCSPMCAAAAAHPQYDRANHWLWQANLEATVWSPEIYDTLSQCIVVTRVFTIDDLNKACPHLMRQYTQFDFDIEVVTRELSHWTNHFTRSAKPPELRFKQDSGKTCEADIGAFCLAFPREVKIPEGDTINLSEESYMLVMERILTHIILIIIAIPEHAESKAEGAAEAIRESLVTLLRQIRDRLYREEIGAMLII
ncbi:hypothetical protein DL95DRAFT_510733 [Leptodontidium sp. 2 PMI_412]|nr:hypothetical protein DL95DRAFT_510733 [Leptodontidium sp. 2 PMI_412]